MKLQEKKQPAFKLLPKNHNSSSINSSKNPSPSLTPSSNPRDFPLYRSSSAISSWRHSYIFSSRDLKNLFTTQIIFIITLISSFSVYFCNQCKCRVLVSLVV
jgi:hypothetical protein